MNKDALWEIVKRINNKILISRLQFYGEFKYIDYCYLCWLKAYEFKNVPYHEYKDIEIYRKKMFKIVQNKLPTSVNMCEFICDNHDYYLEPIQWEYIVNEGCLNTLLDLRNKYPMVYKTSKSGKSLFFIWMDQYLQSMSRFPENDVVIWGLFSNSGIFKDDKLARRADEINNQEWKNLSLSDPEFAENSRQIYKLITESQD